MGRISDPTHLLSGATIVRLSVINQITTSEYGFPVGNASSREWLASCDWNIRSDSVLVMRQLEYYHLLTLEKNELGRNEREVAVSLNRIFQTVQTAPEFADIRDSCTPRGIDIQFTGYTQISIMLFATSKGKALMCHLK